ncbi:unnamed protein product [Urochloa humidicola]
MEHNVDQRQQGPVQEHQHQGHWRSTTATGSPNGSTSSAARNSIRTACSMLRSLTPSCFSRDPPLSPPPPVRVYQLWPGKNVFFLDGRVICGPNPRGLILSAMSLVLSEWIFLAHVVDWSSAHLILISLILMATATVSLLLAATSDPGIIPRNPVSASEEDGTVVVNGVEMRLKFCRTCKVHRPPRSSHCSVCDNCVDKFDHHCPLISQCVGLRNHRLYLLLLCSALALYTFMFAFSMRRIKAKMDITNAGVFSLVRNLPEPFFLAAFSFMATCVLACLLTFHAFLLAKNTTSHEMVKGRYRSSPNPYDKGALANIRECLFEELPPPRVDFRAAARARASSPSPSADAGELA